MPTSPLAHGTLRLPPVEVLTDRDLAAHVVHDHGYSAGYLNDHDGVPFSILDPTTYGDGAPGDALVDECAVDFLTGDRRLAVELHWIDHDIDGDGTFQRAAVDRDTGTWNDHRHTRSPQEYAEAIASAAGYRECFESDPGGWASYIGDSRLDSDDLAEEDVVALAAFEILRAPSFEWPET